MVFRHAKLLKPQFMLGCGVSSVVFPAVVGVLLRQCHHVSVAPHFGDDRSGRDTQTTCVAFDDCLARDHQITRHHIAVDQRIVGGLPQARDRADHRDMGCAQNVVRIDLGHCRFGDGDICHCQQLIIKRVTLFRSQFLTDTRGAGIMNKLFNGFEPWFGPIPQRMSGAIVADRQGKVTTYASLGMSDRGELFIPVTTEVYTGMIIGERNKMGDLDVNITREKKLTNMRSSTSDITVTLRPHRILSLDQSIEFIAEDELVEVTPVSIRLRKMELNSGKRAAAKKKEKYAGE